MGPPQPALRPLHLNCGSSRLPRPSSFALGEEARRFAAPGTGAPPLRCSSLTAAAETAPTLPHVALTSKPGKLRKRKVAFSLHKWPNEASKGAGGVGRNRRLWPWHRGTAPSAPSWLCPSRAQAWRGWAPPAPGLPQGLCPASQPCGENILETGFFYKKHFPMWTVYSASHSLWQPHSLKILECFFHVPPVVNGTVTCASCGPAASRLRRFLVFSGPRLSAGENLFSSDQLHRAKKT